MQLILLFMPFATAAGVYAVFGDAAVWLLSTILLISQAFWFTFLRGIYDEGPSYPMPVPIGPAAVAWLALGWILLYYQFEANWSWWGYGAAFVAIAVTEFAVFVVATFLPFLLRRKRVP